MFDINHFLGYYSNHLWNLCFSFILSKFNRSGAIQHLLHFWIFLEIWSDVLLWFKKSSNFMFPLFQFEWMIPSIFLCLQWINLVCNYFSDVGENDWVVIFVQNELLVNLN
eukprot:TRINITY_DN3852_c1_g1_i3.p1 TRINITY_DN3852_c1_g1~~TRINITY_DN3852_c1_g1_i3.p1  ORF type:complete len:110 (+),score=15.26 TRINITY_DN3852_c1_g1_i3:448-777(+)